jgi:hypothetical protein
MDSIVFKITKYLESRLLSEIMLFQLAFRSICFRYEIVMLCADCPVGALKPEC